MLASEPTEQHVLFAGDADDAANGLYSTLTGSVCSATAPGNPCPGSSFTPVLSAWTMSLHEKDEAASESVQRS